MPHLILIYGLSGSGKSSAARILEDSGTRVIRNLPPQLLCDLVRNAEAKEGASEIAVIPEIASSLDVIDTISALSTLTEQMTKVSEIFLESSDESLINRYKESRRPHPLRLSGGILDAIHSERSMFIPLRRRAQYLIHTDMLDATQLKSELLKSVEIDFKRKLIVSFLSFGFKFGVPPEIDLCFDVRFLENPFFVSELKELSGSDDRVKAFVLSKSETKQFLKSVDSMLDLLLPLYFREGKNYLTVGIGCTGGRHRSVAIADALMNVARSDNVNCSVMHRDLSRRPSA